MKTALFRFLLPFIFWPAAGLAGDVQSFLQVREVVTGWSPDQHLWVNGRIGVGQDQLGELEGWLDDNARNWTVVLMETARSQSHDGRSGMAAVEFALGQGLSNETAFGQLADKRTGESNGAVFVLFLEERKFSYFASDIYDRHSLGEQYWVGRLDAPAIQAMRSGGRIVEAVKNTISSIDSALNRKLKDEEEQKRLADLERQKAVAEAGLFAEKLESRIRETEAHVATFSKTHPTVTGPLATPEISKWQASISAISRLVAIGDIVNAREEFLATDNAISAFQVSLDQWESDAPRFDALAAEIRQHPSPPRASLVAGRLALATDALNSARENHASGDPLYVSQLEEAVHALSDASRHLADWERAEVRRKVIKTTALILALLAFLTFLIISNRLRYPAKKEAEALFLKWKELLRGKFDELFQLMDRVGLVVGSSLDLDERGFGGTTEQLAREAIKAVDELFIMSSVTDQVMDEVNTMIYPRSPLAKLLNGFSSRPYRQSIRILNGEPIGFDDKDRLTSILRIPEASGEKGHARSLLGRLEDYEPFKLSFEKLMAAYDTRQSVAREHITRLEEGIDGLPLTQQQLSITLAKIADRADELALLATDDRLLPLDSLRRTLLPAAEKSLSLSAELGESDPVASYETVIPDATRLITETNALVALADQFRDRDLPRILKCSDQLSELGRSTSWIAEGMAALVLRSEEVAKTAASESASEVITGLEDELTRFTGGVLSCLDLSLRARGVISDRIVSEAEAMTGARSDLSKRLGLAPEKLLAEPGLSPFEKLALARQGVEVALSAIDRGEAGTALRDLDESDRCLDDASALIRLSLESAGTHAEKMEELRETHRSLDAEVVPASAKLTEMKEHYSPSILLFSAPYGDNVNGPQTVLDCVDRAIRRLDEATREFVRSEEAFAAGELILALGLLETIGGELDFARHQLALIDDQYTALKTAEGAIEPALDERRSRHRDLGVLATDRRTCQSTLIEHEKAGGEIEALLADHAKGGGDPFVRLRRCGEVGQSLNAIDDGIRADWKAHEMADAATTGARAALAFCVSYLREAQSDGITDSRVLTRAIQRHAELTADLDTIAASMSAAHQEWPDCFNRINDLTGEVAKVRSTLEQELAAARDAAGEINAASSAIADIHRWRSSHSVAANRRAGNLSLASAKQHLSRGNYAEARQKAIAARGEALRELQRAKAAEAEKVRAAAAAASHAAAMSRRSYRSSFGSSSTSSFSRSSSSGFSSSSFSSGSGFSRSGW